MSFSVKKTMAHEERLQEIARLLGRGYTRREIAEIVNLSLEALNIDCSLISERYKNFSIESAKVVVGAKLHQYEDIRREAWRAWDRSKKDKHKEVVEEGGYKEVVIEGAEGDVGTSKVSLMRLRQIKTKEGRLPDSQYLKIIMDTLKAERELLGLDQPTKVEVAQTFGWDLLSTEPPPKEVPDVLEAEILGISDQSVTPPNPNTESNTERDNTLNKSNMTPRTPDS